MKPLIGHPQVMVGVLILALATFACSLGSATTGTGSQPTPAGSTTKPSASATSQHGTPEEAQAMLKEAVAHYNSVGRTQALADFTNRVSPFFQGDLYVACIDSSLKQIANGGYPNLVGSSIEPLNRAAWDAASTTKISSINYSYLDPLTKTTEPKTLYYEKVGSDVCGVGAYHP